MTHPSPRVGQKVGVAAVLVLRFIRAMLLAGIETLSVIVLHGLRLRALPPAGFHLIPFAPMHPQGVALLAAMVSLTPGTTVIDINAENGEILIHMLDTRNADEAVAAIRSTFEAPLLTLFGRHS